MGTPSGPGYCGGDCVGYGLWGHPLVQGTVEVIVSAKGRGGHSLPLFAQRF